MSRSLYFLAVLLPASALLAAPAPDPFRSGWGTPVNPDRDCKIRHLGGGLTIEMPGTEHDYDPIRKRFNAPRLLRDIEGDFEIRVRVSINRRPSSESSVKGHSACVSAGFLLIYPEPSRCTCDRMEYAVSQLERERDGQGVRQLFGSKLEVESKLEELRARQFAEPRKEHGESRENGAEDYAVMKSWACKVRPSIRTWDRSWQVRQDIICDRGWQDWPLPINVDCAHLRLEHRDGDFYFFISPDGEKWTQLVFRSGPPKKLKLGLAAYSTSSEPSRVRFDQLRLSRGKKKKQ